MSDTKGLLTEIWQAIFAIASDPLQYFNCFRPNFKVPSNWFFSDRIEVLLHESEDEDNQALFSTRLSIILVCKSWYFMGIRLLWSHLRLKEADDTGIASMVHKELYDNPTIASYVTSLTIIPHLHQTIFDECIEMLPIAKIIPLLANLTAISCPSHVATRVPPLLHLDTVILTTDTYSNFHYSYWDKIIIGSHFWQHCQTLHFMATTSEKFCWSLLSIKDAFSV